MRPARLVGAVLARDLTVGGARWSKGRRLTADDLAALAADARAVPVTVLVPDAGRAPRGRGRAPPGGGRRRVRPEVRGPTQSRVDLLAERPASSTSGSRSSSGSTGSTRSRSSPCSTARSSSAATSSRASRSRRTWWPPRRSMPGRGSPGSGAARSSGSRRSSRAASGSSSRSRSAAARDRFEASVRAKVEGLGSAIVAIDYVEDDADAVEAAMAGFVRRPDPLDLILTAGGGEHGPARRRASWRSPRSAGGSSGAASGPPGIHALAGPDRADRDPGPADVRRLLEGHRRGPAAAAAAVRRGRLRADRREARPRRDPDPRASGSASRRMPANWTRPTAREPRRPCRSRR